MSEIPIRAHSCKGQVRLIMFDDAQARSSASRYRALRQALFEDPTLAREPSFQFLLNKAWSAFSSSFQEPVL